MVFLWVAAIFLAPVFMSMGGIFAKISFFIYYFFSPVCHQADERSFHILGYELAVCSRCVSVYVGFLIGVLIYPIKYKLTNIELPPLWFLFLPAALICSDVFLDISGILKNSFWTRSISGAYIGFVLPFFLLPGFIKFFNDTANFFSKNKIQNNTNNINE